MRAVPGPAIFEGFTAHLMVQYSGINHLAMVTGDMNATIRFWRDLLGMRLVTGLGRPGYRHYFFEITDHDMIAFFEWPEAEPLPEKDHGVPVKGPVGFDHVSIDRKRSLGAEGPAGGGGYLGLRGD